MIRQTISASVIMIPLAVSAQETTTLNVDWPSAQNAFASVSKAHRDDVVRFRSSAPKGLSETNLPVLLPVFGAKRSSGNFFTTGDTYGSFFTLPGAQVSIIGTIVAMVVNDESSVFEKNDGVSIDFSEDGIEGSFFSFGASYNVRVSCDSLEDDRCSNEGFITETISNLEVLGGKEIVE